MTKTLTPEQLKSRYEKAQQTKLANQQVKAKQPKPMVICPDGKKRLIVATYRTGAVAPAFKVAYQEEKFWVWKELSKIDAENNLYYVQT